ncbi:MAG: hypothetical protein ACREQK_02205 [Candidatus Binatia bacterium]
MKFRPQLILFFFLIASPAIRPAFAQMLDDAVYNQWVEYQNGEISIKFDETPVDLAVEAIRARTGFHIVMPAAADRKFLNLRLNKLPLEPAMRSLLSVIGFQNFAMVYDQEGRPNRAVVLGAAATERAGLETAAAKSAETASLDLTAEEREQILKQLERWSELNREERGRIEDRLKNLPPSENREVLVKEYGRQILGIKK